jgi:predicted ferric reductase
LRRIARTLIARTIRLIALVNLAVIVGLWLHGGGITGVHSLATLLTSIGRITGLLGVYALLIQILLLARLPFLEWIAGFDRLTVWHKINGKITLYLILAHVGFITAGYALTDRLSFFAQFSVLLGSYPGMTAALIGTILLLLIVLTSMVIVRRRLNYQTWFLVHLMAYSAVALGWFHQIPTGQEFITNPLAAAFWTALYVTTLQLLILFRFGQPILRNLWHRLRVAEVTQESPGVVSLRITGHHLHWINARAGQFFLWRFLDRRRWQEAHPFSLSTAPDGRSFRITVKDLGDFSKRLGEITPGTRVFVEGPFGSFTAEGHSSKYVALIAGGVGITPIRALLEEMSGNLILIYRATRAQDLLFRDELERLSRERGITIHYVIGDHRTPGNEHLMSTPHLRQLIPDIARHAIYLCGPPAMMRTILTNVRRAGVPAQRIYTDAFAL